MEATHLSIHRVNGMIRLPDDKQVILLQSQKNDAQAILTMERDPYFMHLRRCLAYGQTIGQLLVSGGEASNWAAVFDTVLNNTNINETVHFDKPLLVVEVKGEIQGIDNRNLNDFGVCVMGLGLFDTSRLIGQADSLIESSLTAISLALPSSTTTTIDKIGDVSFTKEADSDRFIYSHKISAGVSVNSMTSVFNELVEEAIKMAGILNSQKALKTVANLLSRSLYSKDNLQSFLIAWAALEIFLGKTFGSTYEPMIYGKLKGATNKSAESFIARLKEVMSGKYNIKDKFTVISSTLDPHDCETDIELFESVKKDRDGIHRMEDRTSEFPTSPTQALVRKYLRLHLLANSQIE